MIPKKIFIPPFRLKYENMCFGQTITQRAQGGASKAFRDSFLVRLCTSLTVGSAWSFGRVMVCTTLGAFRFWVFLASGVIADQVISSLGYSNAIFCRSGRHKPELLVTKVGCKLCIKKGAVVRKSVRESKNFLIARQERTK
jgi:hypothetical protein